MKITNAKNIIKAVTARTMETGKQDVVPYLCSIPGLGKSSVVQQVADELGIPMQTVILAQFDAAELGGFPYLSEDNTEYKRARPFYMPNDPESKGILFLDELPQAPLANQNVAAQLTLDRCIGEHKIPEGWTIICAGNPLSSKAGTNSMPSHLKDRLCSLEITPDTEAFRDYALASGIDPMITAYLRERPEWLSKFDPKVDACPSPRSWIKANEALKLSLENSEEYFVLCGVLGEGAVADFTGYKKIWGKLPKFEDIIAKPGATEIPTDPSILYALCSNLAHKVNDNNVDKVIQYIDRFENKEFSAFAMKDILRRHEGLKKNKAVVAWLMTTGKELLLA